MEIFATGLRMGESPRWHDGRLWVCDWVAGEVLSYDERGERRVELTMTGLPFSVDWLPDGRTVLTSTEGVVTADEDGTLTPYGATGPGLERDRRRPARQHLRQRGRVRPDGWRGAEAGLRLGGPPRRVLRAGGRRRLVPQRDGRHRRRGTLIVAESYGHCLTAFDIGDDGTLDNRRVWADLGDAAPDGICLDAEGALVRRRAAPAVRPRGRGRRGARGRGGRPGLLRLHARRRGRPHALRRRQRVGRHQRDRPGRADAVRCSRTARRRRTRAAPEPCVTTSPAAAPSAAARCSSPASAAARRRTRSGSRGRTRSCSCPRWTRSR